MKRHGKKLTLCIETVRNITKDRLTEVRGGVKTTQGTDNCLKYMCPQ